MVASPTPEGVELHAVWRFAEDAGRTDVHPLSLSGAREKARQAQAMNQLRQLALCHLMYRVEHNDAAPPTIEVLRPYAGDGLDQLMACPVSKRPVRMAPDGAMDAPIFWYPPIPDGTGGAVAFPDGRVEWFEQDRLVELDRGHTTE